MNVPVSDSAPDRGLYGVAARGGAITLAAQAARVVITLGSTIWLARLIAPSEFGLFAMVIAITGVSEILRDFGLSMAALRSVSLTQGQASNLFWINSAVGLALTLMIFGLSWPISAFYAEPSLVPIVQIVAPVYFINGLTAQFRVAINRSLRFVALAWCDIIPLLSGLGIAVGFALMGAGVFALVAQQLSAALITLVVAAAFAKWFPGWPRRRQQMRPLITFGLHLTATQLLTYATRNVDSIAIGRVWGAGPLGYYDRAFQLSVAPLNQLNAPLSRVAIPVLSRVAQDPARYSRALQKAQLLACYVTTSVLMLAAGLGVPLVELLLGPGWEFAGQIFSVLALGSIFRALQQIAYWMFMASGRAKSQLRLHLIAQPIVIATTLLGVPFGPLGVAVGNAIGCALAWALSLWWAGRATGVPIRPLFTEATRAALLFGAPAGAIAYVISTFIQGAPWAIVLLGLLGGAAWFALAWCFSKHVRSALRSLGEFARSAVSPGR